ncbi:MAG: hypothetical protein ACRDJN_23345, partial [Chloroflexota bacterium]
MPSWVRDLYPVLHLDALASGHSLGTSEERQAVLMLTFDLHLDLAMNAIQHNRDLLLSVEDCRRSEEGIEGKSRGHNTVTFPEMRRGQVGLCIATVLARVQRGAGRGAGYRTHEITYAVAQGMLAYYRQLERMGVCRMIRTAEELGAAATAWNAAAPSPPAPLP